MAAGKRLAVIGAGPMGLYAAWMAARRGFEVTVLEGERVGASLLTWGGIRLFSPLEMNMPAGLREALPGLPPPEALLTGPELVERVLLPLSRTPQLFGRMRLRHRVVAVARAGLTRRDYAGHPVREEKPFRLAVEGPDGEYLLDADRVLDATGAYARPAWAGPGGLPAPGERAGAGSIIRRLGDLEAFAAGFGAGRVLLLGHGHSAAHALLALRATAERSSKVSVTWVFRSRNLRPLRETPSDPLPERDRLVQAANALAAVPAPWLEVRRNLGLARLSRSGGRLRAFLASPGAHWNPSLAPATPTPGASGATDGGLPDGAMDAGEFDAVAAFTGQVPDSSPLSELAVDLSPVTEGSRRLQAVLAGATDCLSVPRVSLADLASGEPGFHLVGARSYGRSGAFLLRDGIRHLEMILDDAD